MSNRTIVTYFLSIMCASMLFFGLATAGTFAAENWIFGKRFGEHTYAGPFNLSKQTEQEAEVKLHSELLGMQEMLQTDLVYQDAKFQLPSELVKYNPTATVEQARSESENSLVATVSEDGLRTLLSQELPMLTISDSEIASIASGISEKLETGIMPQSVTLTDYLESSQPTVEIATASISVNGFTRPMLDVLKELDGFNMKPKQPFSLLTFLDEVQPGLLEEDEQTILASALYSAALQTNFWVEDRTVRRALIEAVQPGFEATINPKLGLDYVMTNPNDTTYTVHANWKEGSLNVSMEGLPLRYEYEPYVAETNVFKPKTVVQYSEDLLTGQVVVEPGKDGFEVIVQRRIYEDGALLTTEQVSEDFYPPVSRVEQLPLRAPESSGDINGQANDSSGNTGTNDSSNSNGSNASQNTDGTNSNGNNSSSNNNSQGGSDGKNNSNSNGNNGSTTNKPSQNGGDATANPDEKEPVYDKGGQLVE